MKQLKRLSLARAAMMLLMMLLTTASAWAIKTETTSYSISYSSGEFQIKAGSTVTASWNASVMGSNIYWQASQSHQLANAMNIRPNADVVYTNNSMHTDLNSSTTFTFTAPGDIAITSVVFKNGSNVVSGTNSASGSSYTVTLAKDTPFTGFDVTYGALNGSCGTNATWSLDKDGSGNYTVLTISGSGAMTNEYGHDNASIWHTNAPWGYDLTSVTIGNSITSIGQYAFCGCQQLATATIGTGVTTIGEFAFNHCDALTQITLPASVASIGDQCFRNSVGLQRLNIQRTNGLVTLGDKVFNGCNALQNIVAPTLALALQYKDATNWNASAEKMSAVFGGYVFYATNEGGTAAYAITNETDLRHLASAVNDNNEGIANGKTFRQTGDITLSNTNFEPIGYSRYFSGTYDGGGDYTISDLNVGNKYFSNYGLFGYVKNGIVKNVRLVSPTVSGSGTTLGALIGKTDNATVKNCVVINPTVGGSASYKGAIIGSNSSSNSTLENLYFYDGNCNKAIGLGSSDTNVGRARKVTLGSGIGSVTPTATDMANGFVYDNKTYYREGLALTLTTSLSPRTGYYIHYKAINNAGEKTLNGNTYTVNSTDGDVTFTAVYTNYTYTVKFDGNGGTCGDGQMANQAFTYDVAQKLTANAFTRTGYTFAGWAKSANGNVVYSDKQSVNNLTATDGATVTLYAKWTPITYSVAFNGNGKTSGSMSNQSFTYGVAQNLTANAYSRAFTVTYNYNGATDGNSEGSATATATFNGWAKTASGAKVYDDKESVNNLTDTNGATVHLYAKWTDASVTLPTPAKTGHTFGGWYGNEGLTTSMGNGGDSYTPTASITLYAKWTVKQCTITFVTGNGSIVITQDYGTPITAPANPTREGYTFTGWDKAIPAKMPDENMTITAQWTVNKYTVHFDKNHTDVTGSTGSMSNQTFTYGTAQKLTANTFTRTGYTFAGWATSANGNAVYYDKQSVNNLTDTDGATVTLYAKWMPISYTITYELDGGTLLATNPLSFTIETPTFTLNNPTKPGYTFTGWTGTGLTEITKTVVIEQGSTTHRTYTANYEPIRFIKGSLSYECTSGTEVKVTACDPDLTSVTIPTTVTNEDVIYLVTAIEATAFSGCTSLLAVVLDSDTPPTLGSGAFDACTALNTILVPAGEVEAYKAADNWKDYADKIPAIAGTCGTGVYYSYDDVSKTLHIFGTGAMADYSSFDIQWDNYREYITTVVIGDGVTSIGAYAFRDCTGLTSIEIPASVTYIGENAFNSCTSLTSITIPNGVTSIGIAAFYGCTSLESIEIPASMTSIGNSTFAGCTCLESIEIPASVTSIGNCAFCDCTSLASVTIYAPSLSYYGIYIFRNNASGRKIYVFENCMDYYKAMVWYMSADANDIDAIPALAVHDAGGELGSWCTYYNGLADVTVADGTTVYTAKRNNTGGVTLTATGSRIIKRGEAVLLKSAANVVLSSAASSGDGVYTDNELQGVDYETPQDANTTYYVLSKLEGKAFGFYKLKNGVSLGAHKAYLAVANAHDAPEFIGFGENTTGVVPIDHSPLTIDHSAGAWYSIDGRKLQGKPTQKGLYIVNGNKVVIK